MVDSNRIHCYNMDMLCNKRHDFNFNFSQL